MVRYFTHLMKTRHRRKLLDELPVSVNRGAQLGKIKLQDVKRAIDIGKDVLPFVKPAVDRFGPALIDWGQQKVKQAADGLGEARDSILSKGQAIKDEKERQKSLEAARKKAVASSLPPISAKEFFENFENNVSGETDLSDGYMAIAGCYAITTMKSDREKDLSAYEDVYVGCGKSMGFSIYTQLCGFGNVDVYADFKFKRPMMILLFPCEEKDLETRYEALVRDLQAEISYNKWDVLARSDEAR